MSYGQEKRKLLLILLVQIRKKVGLHALYAKITVETSSHSVVRTTRITGKLKDMTLLV